MFKLPILFFLWFMRVFWSGLDFGASANQQLPEARTDGMSWAMSQANRSRLVSPCWDENTSPASASRIFDFRRDHVHQFSLPPSRWWSKAATRNYTIYLLTISHIYTSTKVRHGGLFLFALHDLCNFCRKFAAMLVFQLFTHSSHHTHRRHTSPHLSLTFHTQVPDWVDYSAVI